MKAIGKRKAIGSGIAKAKESRRRKPWSQAEIERGFYLTQADVKPPRRSRRDWDDVSGAQLAASPRLARRYGREMKGGAS